MAQIFHPSMNTVARATIFGAVFFLAAAAWIGAEMARSPYRTGAYVVRDQPIPFSHEHHVSGLGLDCHYCHSTVMTSSFAGMPATKTCMTCHSKIWTNAQMLAPLRQSWSANEPVGWWRVHNLPDYVFFNHAIHVNKGIGCSSCHGNVDRMPLVWQVASLKMEWCLECHRQPQRYIRPVSEVFNMQWQPPADQLARGRELVRQYNIPIERLTNCYTCHR